MKSDDLRESLRLLKGVEYIFLWKNSMSQERSDYNKRLFRDTVISI